MGVVFVICFVTGLLKYNLLQQVLGLNELVLPFAFISDLHDWSGILLGVFVAVHLFLNRRWIVTMTKKMLMGARDRQEE
jgi:cytochrome b subunit of formate dehydrogenase